MVCIWCHERRSIDRDAMIMLSIAVTFHKASMSEHHLFYAEVDESAKLNDGGGLTDEDEDIQLVWVPKSSALEWVAQQEIGDSKTMVAMLWHQQM